jgi:serine/threonine protein kinase
MLQVGQSPVPGYKLEKFLGRGNFGEVWQSTSPGGTKSALKFLNLAQKQGRKEFRAIQRLKQIRHANLMPINAMWLLDQEGKVIPDGYLDTDADILPETLHQTMSVNLLPPHIQPSMLVIAMPQAELNLLQLLREYQLKNPGTGVPLKELLDYMRDAAKAIDYLNSPRHDVGEGVVSFQHSDVKPENLMLMGGSVLLCDFGVAKTLSENSDMRATSMGGSLAYISPESLNGRPSNYSDQFSLAVSYLELRTGELPFESHSMQQVINERTKGVIDLSKLPPPEAKVVQRALSVKPDLRFANAIEFVEALRLATIPAKRKSPLAALGLLALVAGGLVAIPFVLNREEEIPVVEPFIPPDPNNNVVVLPKEGQEERREALELIQSAKLGSSEYSKASQLYAIALRKGFNPEFKQPTRSNLKPFSGQDRNLLQNSFSRLPGREFAWACNEGKTVCTSYNLLAEVSNTIPIPNQIYNLSWRDPQTLAILTKGDSEESDAGKAIYFYRMDGSVTRVPGLFSEMTCVGGKCYAIADGQLQQIEEGGPVEKIEIANESAFSKSWQTDAAVVYDDYNSTSFLPILGENILPVLPSEDVELATLIPRDETDSAGQPQVYPYLVLTTDNESSPFKGIYRLDVDGDNNKVWSSEVVDTETRPLASSKPHPVSIEYLPDADTGNGFMIGHEDGSVSIWTRNAEGKWSCSEEYSTGTDSYVLALGSFVVSDTSGETPIAHKYLVCGSQSGAVFLIKRNQPTEVNHIVQIADFSDVSATGEGRFDDPQTIFTDDSTLAMQFKDGVIVTWSLPHCVMVFEACMAENKFPKL